MTEQERSPPDEPERGRSVLQNLLEAVAVQMENLHQALEKLYGSAWVETAGGWIETAREWIREATEGIRRRRKRDD
jgi:hypothetical protein